MSNYQIKITDFYNIPFDNVKMVHNFFVKEKCVLNYKNLKINFKLRIKTKKNTSLKEVSQSQWLKPYVEFKTQKRTEAQKHGDKHGKALYKLTSNAVYDKTMEKLRNRIDARLLSNKKDHLKWKSLNQAICHKKYLTMI